MNLEEMIKKGKEKTDNNENYYYWLDTVEEYLNNIPNKTYIEKAKNAIKNGRDLGCSSTKRNESKAQITAILMRIYDNQQEEFLNENITKELLSIFTDSRLENVKKQFEKAIQFKNEERFEQSLTEILKSIESMMKLICQLNKLDYEEDFTYKKLTDVLIQHNIIPLNGLLDGFHIMRNKTSAHGKTSTTYTPDKNDVNFEINRGASLLIYLYEKSNL